MSFTPLAVAAPVADEAFVERSARDVTGPDLIGRMYAELRALAASCLPVDPSEGAPPPPFSPTTLVHAAYLDVTVRGLLRHVDRTTLLAAAADAMGRVLAEEARERDERLDRERLTPAIAPRVVPVSGADAVDDWIALEEAVGALEIFDPVRARLARLRLYAGLPMTEVAALMNLALRSLEREWRYTRAWLQNRVRGEERRTRRSS